MSKILSLALAILLAYWGVRRFLRALDAPPLEDKPRSKPAPPSTERDPFEVLEVSPQASKAEIRSAYQAAIRKYHPDYLENMAPELRELAEHRTKEINRAYESLRRRA